MLSVNNLVFCMKIYKKFEFFHSDQCQLVGYVNNFYVSSVSVCNSGFFLFWVMNQLERSITKREKMSGLST
jgi:hypothetical protein